MGMEEETVATDTGMRLVVTLEETAGMKIVGRFLRVEVSVPHESGSMISMILAMIEAGGLGLGVTIEIREIRTDTLSVLQGRPPIAIVDTQKEEIETETIEIGTFNYSVFKKDF